MRRRRKQLTSIRIKPLCFSFGLFLSFSFSALLLLFFVAEMFSTVLADRERRKGTLLLTYHPPIDANQLMFEQQQLADFAFSSLRIFMSIPIKTDEETSPCETSDPGRRKVRSGLSAWGRTESFTGQIIRGSPPVNLRSLARHSRYSFQDELFVENRVYTAILSLGICMLIKLETCFFAKIENRSIPTNSLNPILLWENGRRWLLSQIELLRANHRLITSLSNAYAAHTKSTRIRWFVSYPESEWLSHKPSFTVESESRDKHEVQTNVCGISTADYRGSLIQFKIRQKSNSYVRYGNGIDLKIITGILTSISLVGFHWIRLSLLAREKQKLKNTDGIRKEKNSCLHPGCTDEGLSVSLDAFIQLVHSNKTNPFFPFFSLSLYFSSPRVTAGERKNIFLHRL